ncbi:deoxyguanosine kinase [mine drainage metagenome]|uniref:Deoxyguanosine kinase n=1 Tax=mine drainage metagenome TaxID=410659 RepID=T0Y929_9ZZZZ
MNASPSLIPQLGNARYIVIDGPIGVGKTTLALKLAETLNGQPLLEQADDNPFLERFYRDPRHAALPTQLYFLFQRARALAELKQGELFQPLRIGDYLFAKDRIFAQVTLEADELALYEQVYERLAVDLPVPDLVIGLQASTEVLARRIARRGIAYEQFMRRDYLEQVVAAYTRFFHHYDDSPILIVNASEINPIEREEDYANLLSEIGRTRAGRHFFNPRAAASPPQASPA